jgi:hypothetical protein
MRAELNQLSGVAALLRFPLPEHDVVGDESKASHSDEESDLYPTSTAPPPTFHASASMHQLSTHMPTAAASASSASSAVNPFKKQTAPPISQSVSFNNLAAQKSQGSSSAASTTEGGSKGGGIIKGFASEHL